MPTAYPKASPTEMLGLLVLLNDHKGEEDVARLGDDLDLEIDEILPALEFAELLQLVSVKDGRVKLTEIGRSLLAAPIRERKPILRERLKKTTLFKTLLSALDTAPERRLTEEQVNRLIEFTSAPADSLVQNIINWGRYAELFRYDSDAHVLLPARARPAGRSGGSSSPPNAPPPAEHSPAAAAEKTPPKNGRLPPQQTSRLARALA